MNYAIYISIALLLVATALTWLIRWNRLFLAACLVLAPLPAAFVMALFTERFPGDAANLDKVRFAIAIPACYAIVWLSLLAGWLGNRSRN